MPSQGTDFDFETYKGKLDNAYALAHAYAFLNEASDNLSILKVN